MKRRARASKADKSTSSSVDVVHIVHNDDERNGNNVQCSNDHAVKNLISCSECHNADNHLNKYDDHDFCSEFPLKLLDINQQSKHAETQRVVQGRSAVKLCIPAKKVRQISGEDGTG